MVNGVGAPIASTGRRHGMGADVISETKSGLFAGMGVLLWPDCYV